MSWNWEYLPSEQLVTGGAPAEFLAAVELKAGELKAGELVRAAEALYLDGTRYAPGMTEVANRCGTSMSPGVLSVDVAGEPSG